MNKNNIIIIISLVLMLVFAGVSMKLFSDVETAKQRTEKISDSLQSQLDSNLILRKKSDSLTNVLSNYLATRTDLKDSSAKVLVYDLKTISQTSAKLNNLSAYDQAKMLEKEAFVALNKNDFQTALDKFNQIEKISPSYNMAYEISRLLRKNKSGFLDDITQAQVKKEIVTKYSWGAPADQLKLLKQAVE